MRTTTNTQFLLGLHDPQNNAAWLEFCARFMPVLLAFGRRLGLREHDAQDAAQEALLAFVEGYRQNRYDRTKGRLRTWLYGIASNKIRDLQRARAREHLVADKSNETACLEQIPDDASMSELWEAEWQRSLLTACMEAVQREVKPSSFRVFELLVLQKRPLDEVTAALQMSRDAVLKAKTRVLARMREIRGGLEAEW